MMGSQQLCCLSASICALMHLFFPSPNREEGVSLDQKELKGQKERRENR